jgi:hypothetical protein
MKAFATCHEQHLIRIDNNVFSPTCQVRSLRYGKQTWKLGEKSSCENLSGTPAPRRSSTTPIAESTSRVRVNAGVG